MAILLPGFTYLKVYSLAGPWLISPVHSLHWLTHWLLPGFTYLKVYSLAGPWLISLVHSLTALSLSPHWLLPGFTYLKVYSLAGPWIISLVHSLTALSLSHSLAPAWLYLLESVFPGRTLAHLTKTQNKS